MLFSKNTCFISVHFWFYWPTKNGAKDTKETIIWSESVCVCKDQLYADPIPHPKCKRFFTTPVRWRGMSDKMKFVGSLFCLATCAPPDMRSKSLLHFSFTLFIHQIVSLVENHPVTKLCSQIFHFVWQMVLHAYPLVAETQLQAPWHMQYHTIWKPIKNNPVKFTLYVCSYRIVFFFFDFWLFPIMFELFWMYRWIWTKSQYAGCVSTMISSKEQKYLML